MKGLILIILISLLVSCKEECTGDCGNILLSGMVIDETGKGLGKVPVQVFWKSRGFGFFSSKTSITKTRTDRNGRFKISTEIDKARFNFHYLVIEATIPSGYIHAYDSSYGVVEESFTKYSTSIDDVNLKVYRETDLTIKLIRNQNDNFINFTLAYAYAKTGIQIFQITLNTSIPVDQEFNVKTSANKYTKISYMKTYGFGNFKTFVDSIYCFSSSKNIHVVNY